MGIWVSYTSWLVHSSHLDYSGVARSVCSTEHSNLINYTVNGLAADETLQPELLPLSAPSVVLVLQTPPSWRDELTLAAHSQADGLRQPREREILKACSQDSNEHEPH